MFRMFEKITIPRILLFNNRLQTKTCLINWWPSSLRWRSKSCPNEVDINTSYTKFYLFGDINDIYNTMSPLCCCRSQSSRSCSICSPLFHTGSSFHFSHKRLRDATKCPRIAWNSTQDNTGSNTASFCCWLTWKRRVCPEFLVSADCYDSELLGQSNSQE